MFPELFVKMYDADDETGGGSSIGGNSAITELDGEDDGELSTESSEAVTEEKPITESTTYGEPVTEETELDDAALLDALAKKTGVKIDKLDKLKGFDQFGALTTKHQDLSSDMKAVRAALAAQGINYDSILSNGRNLLQGQPANFQQPSNKAPELPPRLAALDEEGRGVLTDSWIYNFNTNAPSILPAIAEAIKPSLLKSLKEEVMESIGYDKFLEANPDYETEWKDAVDSLAQKLNIPKVTSANRELLLEQLRGKVNKTVTALGDTNKGKLIGQPPPVGSNRREGGEPQINWDEPNEDKFWAQAKNVYAQRQKNSKGK